VVISPFFSAAPTAKATSRQSDAVKPLPINAHAVHIFTNSRSSMVFLLLLSPPPPLPPPRRKALEEEEGPVVVARDWQKTVSKAFATRFSRRMSSSSVSSYRYLPLAEFAAANDDDDAR